MKQARQWKLQSTHRLSVGWVYNREMISMSLTVSGLASELKCLAVRPWGCLGILQSKPPLNWLSGGCPSKMQMHLLSCLQWLSPTLHSCLVPVEFEFAKPCDHLSTSHVFLKLNVILETYRGREHKRSSSSSEPSASEPLFL